MLRYCNPSVREDSHTERSEVSLFRPQLLGGLELKCWRPEYWKTRYAGL